MRLSSLTLSGQTKTQRVTLCLGNHGQAHAGVSTGGLDDRAAWLELSLALRCLDHLACNSIFDRAARIEVLDLGQDQRLRSAGDPSQPEQRRMADKIDQRVDVLHASDSTAQESSEGRDFLLGSAALVVRMEIAVDPLVGLPADVGQQAQNLDVQPDHRYGQAECTTPRLAGRGTHLDTLLDVVEVQHQVQHGKHGTKQ